MASQQNNGKGRIYQSKPAETTYQGAAQSRGINPVRAVSDEKKLQQYSNQIVADGDTKRRELLRAQQMQSRALQAQQTSDRGPLKISNSLEASTQKIEQLYQQSSLKAEQ